jgi:hypothetical protein
MAEGTNNGGSAPAQGNGTVGALDVESVMSRAEAAFEDLGDDDELDMGEPDDPAATEYELGDDGDEQPEDEPEPEEELAEDEPEEEKPKKPGVPARGSKDKPYTV